MDERNEVGVGAPFERVEIDRVSLAVTDDGAGLPLVCLHATGHGGSDFDTIRSRLRDRCRVITVDWPGHGRSGEDRKAASAARYAELLGVLIEDRGLERPVILGNSIGGAAAIIHAARNPKTVSGLILADPGGLLPVNCLTKAASRAIRAFFEAGARGRGWFGSAYSVYYRLILQRRAAAERRRTIVAAGYQHAPVLAQAWRSFGEPEADLRKLVPAIICPVLFTWARNDHIVSYWRSSRAVKAFPNATLKLFRGGHSAFLEDEDRFMASLEHFLNRLETSGDVDSRRGGLGRVEESAGFVDG